MRHGLRTTVGREGLKEIVNEFKQQIAVGNVMVGWNKTPEKLGRQVSKMEGSLITVTEVTRSWGEWIRKTFYRNTFCDTIDRLKEPLFGPFPGGKMLKSNVNEYSSWCLLLNAARTWLFLS